MDLFEPHNLLFVYGALRRGMEREQFLSKEKTKFLGIATTAGILYAIGDFPALIVDPAVVNSALDGTSRHLPTAILEPVQFAGAERQVRGELFEIFDPSALITWLIIH